MKGGAGQSKDVNMRAIPKRGRQRNIAVFASIQQQTINKHRQPE
ncbi:hypothetical protein [Glaciimonas immobilis]|uniref:Uncharacterized protein n=1 Tax=Glaciimonas immobilis TaxID=728004 RepID=A0A840S269_9BURK|nr:hypothetical protein [Glaciimonas immobilis]MBB5202639.1 hypothetical protein [Glaciimonas immobilis]